MVRGGRVRLVRVLRFLLPVFLLALLPTFAKAQVAHVQTFTASSASPPSVTSLSVSNITSGTDQLYVAAIAYYGDGGVVSLTSVSGGGLTWTLQKKQCSRRLNRAFIEVWQAFGSPGASFNVDITLSGIAVVSAAVSRYSGADPTTPTEGADGSNTGGQGVNAVCDGFDEETANLSLGLTSSQNDSILFVASHPRNKSISVADADYTQRAAILNSDGGNGAYLYVHERSLAAAGTDSADHTIGAVTGWEMAGLVINPAPSNNLIGHWNFNEGTGQTAGDSSTSNNDGTLGPTASVESGDPTWACSNTALEFDGSDDEVKLGSVAVGDSAAWSVSAWIKMSPDTADKRTIYGEGNTAQTEYFYLQVAQGGNNVTFYSQNAGASNTASLTGTTNVEDDAWHLVTVVQRSKTDRELYVGTNSEDTSVQNAGTLSFNTASIGYLRTDWVADPFKGLIDDVRIYDYALSTAEIATLNSSPPAACGATPAVTSAVAEISPNDVETSSTGNSFSYDIQATISGAATGVNEVNITVPGTFGAPTITDVQDDGVSVGYTNNTVGNAISLALTTKITASSKITVLFDADAPTSADATGVDFTSTVDDTGTGDAAQSTTEGNGDGDAGDNNSWTVTTTDPAPFSCPIGSSLFSDGFESGNFSAWDGTSEGTAGDSITVSTVVAKTGTYSARGVSDTTYPAQAIVYKSVDGQTEIHAKAEIYLPTGFSGGTDIVALRFGNGWSNIVSANIDSDRTMFIWNNVASEGYGVGTTPALSMDAWHTIELRATISDTVGEARLWIDGTLEITATNKNLGTSNADRLDTPFYWGTPGTSADTIYVDDVEICGTPASPAVTSAVAEISPTDVTTSSTGNSFSYDIQATISGAATGVNEVNITVPGTFGAPTITDVQDDGVSVGYTNNTVGNAISLALTTKVTASSKITVLFNSDAPTSADATGKDFTSTVDDSGTATAAQSTTEGNGDGDAGDANSWTVTTTDGGGGGGGACPIDVFIAVENDDAEELVSSGAMDLSSSDLELIADGGDQLVGVRFTNIDIDQGATITNAYLEFTAQEAPKSNAAELYFKAHDTDNAPIFSSTAGDISNRATTTASVTWANVPSWSTNGAQYQSPDISSVIQEIVDRPGWTNNNAIAIIITGTTGSHRVADAHGTGTNVKLHVECSAGATPAVTSAVAEISPNNVVTSSTANSFSYDIQATIDGTATGVNRVDITVPGTFTVNANPISDVKVNDVSVAYTDNSAGSTVRADITTKVTASSKITVLFNVDAPATQDLVGVDFTSTVDDTGSADVAQATTEGNGDGDNGDLNSWTVTTTNAVGGSCDVDTSGTYFDAEDYTALVNGTNGQFSVLTTEPGYNGSGYIATPNANGQAGQKVDYTINFPTTGTYYVWIRAHATTSGDDSIFFGYDGVLVPAAGNFDFTQGIGWHWHDQSAASFTVSTAGQHTLNLWGREDDLKADSIYITQTPGTLPGGITVGIPTGATVIDPSNCAGTPAANAAVAEISPTNVTTSSTGNAFSYDIQASISGAATGVNRVAITVPVTFGAPTVSDVKVNDVSVAYTDNTAGNNISVDLTTKVTTSSKITVQFTSNAPTTQDLTGVDFTSTVDDTGTGDAAQATTEGDGDGEPGDSNSWTVTTTDGAGGGGGGGACPAPGAGGWYNSSWLYRKPLSIGAGNVGSDLTNFPVLVSIASDTDLAADAQGDFDDILFTASDGTTKLSHEIEQYNETTGELVAWVKVPTVSSSVDTVFYLYYGNASATNQQDPTGVWSNGYAGVWHLKEDPSGTAPQMADSTVNNLDGTTVGTMNSADQVAGQIAGSLDLDGSNDYVDSLDYDVLGTISVSAWVYWNATSSNNEGIISKRTSSENPGNWALRFNSGLLEWMVWDGVDSSDKLFSVSAPVAGQWLYVVTTFDDSINTARMYLDGALENSSTGFTKNLADTPEIIKLGQHGQGSTTLNGRLDEVRLSSTIRSADWISAEYVNQADHDNFQALCGEETQGSGGDPGDSIVNSTGDAGDNNAGDGVCNTGGTNSASATECTLRAAIQEANAYAGANDITFNMPTTESGYTASPLSYTITPASALPTITGQITIDGSSQPDFPGTPIVLLDGNDIAGNGLTLSGTADSSTIRGLIIRDFGGNGIELQAGSDSHTIAGNYIGALTASGTDAGATEPNASRGMEIYGSSNTIGGTVAADRNVISGNGAEGILIRTGAGSNIIRGNYIGVASNGTTALGNQQEAIQILSGAAGTTIGGSASGAGNVIGANGIASGAAISLEGDGTDNTVIQGNYIGTDSGGTVDLGNIRSGVEVRGTSSAATSPLNTLIGGTGAGEGNVIRFNDLDGVRIRDVAVDVTILGNSIDNSSQQGIDLWPASTNDNVTENDAGDSDAGSNDLLNFPVITAAAETSGTIAVDFDLDVAAGDYRIEFFKNPSGADGSGNGEGETYASAVTISHGGTGSESFSHSFSGTQGDIITATATEQSAGPVYGSTSEFSDAFTTTLGGSLIGHYQFNEGTGQTAGDASAGSNHATLGPTSGSESADPNWFCVADGYALDFDGTNDEVRLPNVPIGNRDAWSVSAWIKMGADTADKRAIYGEGNTTDRQYLFLYVDQALGHVEYYSEGSGATNPVSLNGSTNVETDTWQLITVVHRSKTDHELYVGTNSEATSTNNSGTLSMDTASIGLLRTQGNPGPGVVASDPFLGLIDNVRIYDYALSTSEIAALAASPPGAPCGAVSSAVAEISPNDVATNSTGNSFSYDIQATIDTGDTGVNRVSITVPGTFGAPTVTGVQVGGSGVGYSDNTAGNNIVVDLSTKVTSSNRITVLFNADAPTTADATGVNFTSTVDDTGTAEAAQSTTEGNGDGNGGDNNSWTVTTTDPGSIGACPVANTIFSDNFESGNLNAWDTVSTGTGSDSIAASSARSKNGSYSARAEVDNVSTARARVIEDFTAQTTVSARAWFYLDPSWSATGNIEVLYLLDTGASQVLAALIKPDMTLTMWNNVENDAYNTTTTIAKGEWHSIEIQAVINGVNSEARMWFDDVLISEQTGINLGSTSISRLHAGYHWAFVQTEPNILFMDDVEICDVPMGPPGNLIGHWKFDEGTGQTAADSSTSNNDGTLGNTAGSDTFDPAWACVAGGYALDFDGSDKKVEVGSVSINNRDAWTLSAWIKMSADTADQRTIYAEGSSTVDEYLFLYVDDIAATAKFWIKDSSSSMSPLESTTNVEDGNWHLITVVQRAKNDRELFVDGISEDSDIFGIGTLSFDLPRIGFLETGAWDADPFKGTIEDLRIYDYALSSSDISALAASPPTDCGGNVLIIADDKTSPGASDTALQAYLEGRGLTIFYADDDDAEYETAIAANNIDVVYISSSAFSSKIEPADVGLLTVGVVNANNDNNDDLCLGGADTNSTAVTTVNLVDNSHFITSPYSTGNFSAYSSGARLIWGGNYGAGAQVLAQNPSNASEGALVAFEKDAMLHNCPSSPIAAPARRVGTYADADFSVWTATTKDIIYRALIWGSGNNGGGNDAVTSAVAEISPNDVATSSTGNAFSYDIQVTIGGSSTGVNRVAVIVPAGFSNVSVTGVQVDGAGVAYTDNTIGNAISVDLTTKVTASGKITILFSADAPTSADAIGVDFTSTVDDSGTGIAAQSATEGNGDGDAGDANSWTVTTTDPAVAASAAVAEISPNNVVTSSTGNSLSYDIALTISGGDTGVDRVAITVPGTFGAPTVTAVQVDGGGVAYTNNTAGNNISVDLTTKVTVSSRITVLFDADAPTAQDLVGVNFTSTVDDTGSGAGAQATTQGNGDGNAGDSNSWVVTTTDPGAFSCPIGSSLFSDGFETGDLSAWDGSNEGTAGDSITVSTVVANSGTYSAKGVSDTTYPAQAIVWKTVTGQTTIHAKAEIYLPTGFTGGSDLVALRFGNGWTNIVTATVNNDRTMFIWNDVVSEAYGYGATSTVSMDAWHTIELQAVVSDTAGEARLWIDGNLEITATGKNLGTSNADRLDTPFYWGTPGTAADTIYVDDVEICGTPTPAVTSAVAEISPNDVATSSTGNSFSYDIQATIGGGDTGVDRVAITVPGNFGAPTVTGVQVDGVGVAYTNNTVGNAISVDLTTKVTVSSRITILFDADAPTTQDLTGSNFLSTVDDSGTADAAQDTTEGNGDGDAGDNNSWTVTTTDAGGGACVAFDAASTQSIPSTSPNPVTFSHTTSGTDRLLLVSVASQPNGDDGIFEAVTGITYGGQALTVVGTAAQGPDNARIEIWQLVNPPTGSNTVSITFNDAFDDPVNSEGASAGATSFTGVKQSTPLGTFTSANSSGTTDTPSVTVSSAVGELVFDTMARKANPISVGAGQTELWNLCTDASCLNVGGGASTEPGAASVTMSWSPDNNRWALGAVPIKPSGNCNSAVTAAVAEISPNSVTAGSTGVAFSYDINATLSGGDTGVNTVAITVPGTFGVPTVTDVLVNGFSVPYTDNTSGHSISVVLTTKMTTTGRITVLFSADAPIGQDLTGVDFVSTVDDNATSDAAQATTEGNGDGDAGDSNSWTVITTAGGGGPANPVVNSTGDSSDNNAGNGVCDTGGLNSQSNVECTLRAAIQEANASGGLDTITFNMPTSEPGYSGAPLSYTINPGSALPTIVDQVTIDGTSQPGYPGTPIVVLDGNNLGASGLTLGATGDSSTIRGFVIRDFGANGIHVATGSDGNTIAGNYIGRLNVSGTDAGVGEENTVRGIELLGSSNTIGGTAAADRNVISGNGGEGIIIRSGASSNIVRGNYIGVAADGTTALGNDQEGIQIDTGSPGTIIGGLAAGAENVIGANGISSGAAISIGGDGSDNTVVQGNYIGTDASGTLDLGNIRSGVEVRGTGSAATSPLNTLIGGTAAGEGNLIRYNDLDGVRIRDVAVDVAILGNDIYDSSQIGIDLWPSSTNDDVTANDSGDGDSGSNHLMNFPVITSAIWNAGNVDVNFDLDVPAGNYRVEFFKNPAGADPSGNGEGQSYIGYVNIVHGGSGSESFAHSFSGSLGDILSATATQELSGPTFVNTSEFSATYVVTAGAAVASVTAEISPNDVATAGGAYSFEYDIAAVIGAANTGVDRVAITVPGSFGVNASPVTNVLVDGSSVAFTDNSVGNAISVDLTSKVTSNARITVLFEADSPNAEDLTGVDFTSTVDDTTTGDAAQAATEGNGDGDTEDNNSWTVTTTGAPPGGGGACTIATDGTASSGTSLASGHTSITISHTTSGTDRLMLVGVSINNDGLETVSSVTYNGVNLGFVGAVNEADDARVEIWSLAAPATGTHDVVITFSATLIRSAVAGVQTFTGVDQSTPLGAFAGNNNTNAGPASITVSSAADEMVFAVMSGETVTSVTVDAPASELWNLNEPSPGPTEFGAGATSAGAASVVVDFSLGGSDHWSAGGVSIKPSQNCGTAVDTAVAEISPNNVSTSSTGNAFAYDIQTNITGTDTGVDQVTITVPGSFTMGTVSDVLVNGVSVSYTDNTSGNNISIDLASKLTSSARITVLFTADAPTSEDLVGDDFISTVDDSGSIAAAQATTEGNGDGDAGDLNDWTVTTTDAAGASCDIDPAGTYIEAENYTSLVNGSGPGTFVFESTQAGYNGTGYLSSSGGSNTEPPENMRADYTVNFTTTGTYYIWIRGYALDSSSDSIFIGIDGTWIGALNEGGTYNQWIWSDNAQSGVNTINIPTAGWYTINLWVREADHKVDGIYITQDAGTIPGGTSIGIPETGGGGGTFTKRVGVSTDDAEQRVTSAFGMDLTSSDLELHDDGGDGYVGMRWTGVTIPQGATITDARIQFHVDEIAAESSVALTVTFRGEDVDNAATFTSTASDISNRTETTASVDWAIPTWVAIDDELPAQLSADLSPIVQEIVNRPGWASGNAMVIMIKAWSGSGGRTAESYNGESTAAAELQIDYSTGGGTPVTVIDPSNCAGGPGISHFAIIHDGTGINCQAENVTIEAHTASHAVDTLFSGTMTIATSTLHGDWSLVSGSGSLTNGAKGNAVYGFSTADNGVVTLGLRDTFVETTNINVSSQGMSEDVTEDPNLVFARSGFNFLADSAKNTIGIQIGGKSSNVAPGAQTLELQAVKTNDDTGACEAALVGPNVIDIGFECEDPDTCATNSLTFNGTSVPANANNAVPTYARVNMDFGTAADNTATFTMQYDDVGKIRLYARSRILPSGEEMLGGSNSFVVRPFAFDMVVSGNPAASGPGGSVFTSAGTEFTAAVTALLWEAGDDLDNDGIADNHDDTDPSNNADLTNNAAAPNYGYEYAVEQVLLTAALDQPAGGANPGLSGGTSITIFNGGSGTTTTVRYDEVGIIEMAAQVADNDYLGIGAAETQKITSKSGYVGRFNPAQYAVTASDINPACSATFTYARQPFTGSMTIEAQNGAAGGNTRTENFRGGFVTLDPATELTFVNSATSTAYNSKSVTYNQNFDSGNFGEAVLALQFRWDMPEQAPATSTVQNTAVTDEVTTLVGAPVSIGATPVRHGRAFVGTAAGSELVDLGVVMRTEYYLSSASGYVVNAEDFCSTNAVLSLSNFADNLSLGETCVQDSGNPGLSGAGCTVAGPVLERYDDPLIAGNANLWLRAPGAGNDGSANLNADVPAWLEFDWNTGVPGLEDPSGYIVFGIYGGDKNQVYRRELY